MNKWINKLCLVGLVLCPVSNALAWCNSCGGDGSCCRCPSGQAQCLYGHASCEEACGLTSSSSGGLPSANSELATTLGKALGKAIADSIRGNPEEEAARRAELAAQQKRAAEEKARQDEETKQRLIGTLQGVDSSSQLGLMGVDAAPDLQLITGDQSVSASNSPAKPNENTNQTQSQPKSAAFTKGYDDASQCFSQNSGPHCASLAGEEWQTCLADYRAGYQVGDKERALLMQQAWQAGQLAGAKGELANGAADPLADGPCRVEWIQTYNKGHFQGKHAKASSGLSKSVDDAIPHTPTGESVRKGFQAIQNGDWRAALAWFQDAHNKEPGDPSLGRLVDLAQFTLDYRTQPQTPAVEKNSTPTHSPKQNSTISSSNGAEAKSANGVELAGASSMAARARADAAFKQYVEKYGDRNAVGRASAVSKAARGDGYSDEELKAQLQKALIDYRKNYRKNHPDDSDKSVGDSPTADEIVLGGKG